MSELKLLNCPFCGGEVYFATEDYNDEITHLICCDNCDLKFYGSYSYGIKHHIANHWNRRTPMANIVEKLEDELLTSQSAHAEAVIGMCGVSASGYSGEISAYTKAINIVKQEINNGENNT